MELKRYWLFVYPNQNNKGGLQNMVFSSNSIPDCRKILQENYPNDYNFELFDSFEKIILETNVNDSTENEWYTWFNREKKEPKTPPSESMFH
ncbi:MAG: hypothetical protein ACEPOZ_00525 [Marinifilaceae bacterium]|jgi:hypothetical protein